MCCNCWSGSPRFKAKDIFDFLHPLLQKMPESDSKKCADVMADIRNPLKCWQTFLHAESEVGDAETLQEDEVAEATAAEDANRNELEKKKADFNKATGALLELLVDLMRGKHLEDCKELANNETKISEAVSQAARQSQQSQQSSANDLIKSLCTVVQAFDTSNKSISATISSSCPAPSLISTLNAAEKEESAAKREHVWKLVQAERRKWVTFSVPKSFTSKEHLLAAFRASGKVFGHSGQLNVNHRLLVASADLLTEAASEPWTQLPSPDKTAWKAICDFSSSSSGSTDFTLLFDGRIRDMRKVLAPWLCLSKLCIDSFSYFWHL